MGSAAANWISRVCLVLLLTLPVTACSHAPVYAPVTDLGVSSATPVRAAPVKKSISYRHAIASPQASTFVSVPESSTKQLAWVWPANGRILSVFGEGRKGVNIGGKERDPVVAAAAGKIVYAGDGLRGYGNLIIIKHDSHYMTAYAYNRSLAVSVGDSVKAGQKIAEMGHDNANKAMLHFELRKDGKAINPMQIHGILN